MLHRRRSDQSETGEELDSYQIQALLRSYGRNPLSFLLLLDAHWRWFCFADVEGVVPYLVSHGAAVVWGDPLCAPRDSNALLAKFRSAMRAKGRRTCHVVVEEATAARVIALGGAAIKIGEEPIFDLTTWRRPAGKGGKHLRWYLNKAREASVEAFEYRPGCGRDARLERQILDLQARWEASLGHQPAQSLMKTDPLALAEHKRIFLAYRDDLPLAVLGCSPVYARDGWYLEDLIRMPDAPRGVTELLVVTALESLSAEGFAFASLGIAPFRASESQIDPRAQRLAGLLTFALRRFDARYHFAALSSYKSKFRPSSWEPRYVAFSPAWPTMGVIRAVVEVIDRSGGA